MRCNGLNWKDYGRDSEARASRVIGGRYKIMCFPGGSMTWFGAIEETHYRIDYYAPGDGSGKFVRTPRGTPGTLAEAKRMAEEDHAARVHQFFERKEKNR